MTVPRVDGAALDRLAEHVRERQEQQHRAAHGRAAAGTARRPCAPRRLQVAVGELAALGAAGGAGGVDQRGEVVGAHRTCGARAPPTSGTSAPRADEPLHRARLVAARARSATPVSVGELVAHLLDERGVLGRLHDDRDRARVDEDPRDLLGRRGLVDRHGDGAGGEDRVVEQRPLVAGAREQRDPVARLDAGGDQAARHGGDLGRERRGR